MADFTETSQQIGPERMYALLDHVLELARDCIEERGGHVIDTAGDGLLAAFGAPNALENAPLESCRAAFRFRQAIAAEAIELERRFGVVPLFRTGIGGGSAVIARLDERTIKVVGEPVNKAARLQALAEPGEIIISETIRAEAEGHVATTDRGSVELKGFPAPVRIHRLDSLVDTLSRFEGAERRGLTALVSREAELRTASEALAGATAGGLVVITGAPGIGKSRLTHEIIAHSAPHRPCYVGQCAPGGQASAYGPFVDILRQAGRAAWTASRAEILAAVVARHPGLNDPDAARQFLEPEQTQRDQTERALKTRAYLVGLLKGLNEVENCVFVIEDAHWIDTASNALLSGLAATSVPIVVTSRPGFRADWFESRGATRIPLAPLSEANIRSLAETRLGGPVGAALGALICEKAEGVPLMAEEIARALTQGGRLRDGADGLELAEPDGSLLTGNLEQLVLSRVDRLTPEQKTSLQYAATIGRDFSDILLSDALGRPSGLAEIAAEPGLVERIGGGQWRFSHALIRDAIYDSLLTEQRQTAHTRIAEAIEASPGSLAERWSFLAEHFLRTRHPERSVPYLVRAAGQSLNVYALFDVDQHLDRAMGFLETDPGLIDGVGFCELAVNWLRALHQIGDFGRIRKVAARVLPRLEQSGYSPSLSIARTLTSIALSHSRDYVAGRDLALKTLADADDHDDGWGAAWAKVALMRIYDETKWEGLATIRALASEIEPEAERADDRHLAMSALYLLSSACRSSGRRLEALKVADRIEAYSTTHNDRRARAFAFWARALVYSVEGNPEKAHAVIRLARNDAIPGSADERVCAGIELFARTFLEPPEALRQSIRNLMAEARALQDFNIAHAMEWTLAVLEIRAGNLALGWRMLELFQRDAMQAGNINLCAQACMSKAEILLSVAGLVDPIAEAPDDRPVFARKRPGVADLVRFLALKLTARRRAADSLHAYLALPGSDEGAHEARCRISLGLIAASRGRKAEARRLLEEGLAMAEKDQHEGLAGRARRALSACSVSV